MKKLTVILAAVCLFAGYSPAQDTNAPSSDTLKAHLISLAQDVSHTKVISVAVYPTFAPDIVVDGKKSQWGAGLALLCPAEVIPALEGNAIASHAYGGLRFDLLGGSFFASTVALGAKADFQIYGHNFTYFIESGVNIPISGAGNKNIELGAMAGTGIKTQFASFGKVDANGNRAGFFDGFAAVEKWTQFQGQVYHVGICVGMRL